MSVFFLPHWHLGTFVHYGTFDTEDVILRSRRRHN